MLNYFLYRFAQIVAVSLPLQAAYALAVLISDGRLLFAFEDNRNVKANLRAIFPEKSAREIRDIRVRMNRNFAKYLVDFFRFQGINQEYIKEHIIVENRHFLDEALTLKKGVIIFTAHLGNWELGGVAIAQLGYPFSAVALPHKSKKVDDFFNFQRESKGVSVIPLGKAFIRCLNILKHNGLIALVGDRDFTRDGGIMIDFLGKPAQLPKGPAMISLMAGSPIVPAFMIRNSNGNSFTLKFEKPIIVRPSEVNGVSDGKPFRIKKVNEDEIRQAAGPCRDIMEDYIKKFPDQWYMFKKYWIE